MKEVIVLIDGHNYTFQVPTSTTIVEVTKALEGIGGRPKDRG